MKRLLCLSQSLVVSSRIVRQITSHARAGCLPEGPSLKHFLESDGTRQQHAPFDAIPYISPEDLKANGRKGKLPNGHVRKPDLIFEFLMFCLLCFSVH